MCVLLKHHARAYTHLYIYICDKFPSGYDGPLNHFNFPFDWLNHNILRALLGCRCCYFFSFMKITAYFSNQLIIKVIRLFDSLSLVVSFIFISWWQRRRHCTLSPLILFFLGKNERQRDNARVRWKSSQNTKTYSIWTHVSCHTLIAHH